MDKEIFVPGTVKPEEDYRELERLGAKLGIPVVLSNLKVEVQNPDDEEVVVHYDGRSRTWTRSYWNGLFEGHMPGMSSAPTLTAFGDGYLGDVDVGTYNVSSHYHNAASSSSSVYPFLFFPGPAAAAVGVSTYGIVVGSGTTPENFDMPFMSKKFANGTTAGTISYQAQNQPSISYNASTHTWSASVSRVFNNNSGGTLSITETGFYGTQGGNGGSSVTSALCRDLLGSPISLVNGAQLTVTYTFTLQFPTVDTSAPWSNVQMQLFNDNATAGATTCIDQSSYGRTYTAVGTPPQYSGTQKPTGMTTALVGSAAGCFTTPHVAALDPLDNNWSLEFWVYVPSSVNCVLLTKRANSSGFGPIQIDIVSGVVRFKMSTTGASWDLDLAIATTYPTATYVSIIKHGRRIIIKGSSGGAVSNYYADTLPLALVSNTANWYIGGDSNGNYMGSGTYLSNLRLSIGTPRGPGSSNLWYGDAVQYTAATWTLPLAQS